MNYKEFLDAVYEELDGEIRHKDVKRVTDAVFDVIKSTLTRGGVVAVSRFGVFRTVETKGRRHFDVNTGELIEATPFHRPVLRFYPSVRNAVRRALDDA